jgi:hypothetical protein
MRFIFKTDYRQDIRLAKHPGHVFWYGLLSLLLLAAPWLLAEYWLAQLTFVLIYAIAGLGLMLLAGFTGQFSLGHAAFLGVGAYTQAVLLAAGWPFLLALACAAGAVCRRGRGGGFARAARQGHLPGHGHAGVWFHRRGGAGTLGVGDRGQRGACTSRRRRSWAGRSRVGRRSTSFACASPCWPRWAC